MENIITVDEANASSKNQLIGKCLEQNKLINRMQIEAIQKEKEINILRGIVRRYDKGLTSRFQ
ncbi:hypothetical protein [Peribacillus frigoritolerans]|uniref:hypothetical protein n=1 Tax=Peribacillus frigoritolerans TaxID=450367 RepID=UPI002EA1BDE2|nr:hypothetical protein [Peribacillus frigoritolerans]